MAHRGIKMQNNFNFSIQTLRSSFSVLFVRFTLVRSFLAKIIVLLHFKKLIIISVLFLLFSFSPASASFLGIDFGGGDASSRLPEPDKLGLPFENAGEATRPVVLIIKEAIKYVGLLAILVVSWGGIQFLTSMGNDEKVKHAKHTIIYALVGVLLSVVAYTIIDIVNSLRI